MSLFSESLQARKTVMMSSQNSTGSITECRYGSLSMTSTPSTVHLRINSKLTSKDYISEAKMNLLNLNAYKNHEEM